ncbi:MAG: glucose-1-phosphate thymidylyltransferase [Candidatus Lokiarchaeia archaeon]
MKGLLLAGGHGSRLRPLTYTGNKHMLPVANKPIILYGLEHLRNAGIRDIGIVLGPIKEGVKELIGGGSKFGVRVTYIEQNEPRGLAHAVKVSENFLKEDPFVMYLGDNLLKSGIETLLNDFKKTSPEAVIAVTKVKDPRRFGIVEMEGNKIIRLVEKPKSPKSDLALIGVYLFRSSIFDAIEKIKPSWRNELEITDAIQELVNANYDIHVHFVSGWWKDTGKPEDLLEANQLILNDIEPENEGELHVNVIIQGNVRIGAGTIIREGCCLRGPIIIGKRCEIGPKTYIGPYTSIGDNVTICGGEVEYSIVMPETKIICEKRIINSLIGRNVSIISSNKGIPAGHTLIIGDRSFVSL